MATKTAISIHVFKNGDSHYMGRKFVVNQKQTRNFDSFLTMVTTGVKPSYGAVRRLYTPTNGHRVDDLGTLSDNNFYVAAGMERFKRVQYFSIGSKTSAQKHKTREIRPVQHSRILVSAKFKKTLDKPKVIHVFRNGDILYPAVRLLLTKRMLTDWQIVYNIVTDKVNLVSGAVRRLYHMDGRLVVDLNELESESSYVAAGIEKFKKVAYGVNGPLEPSSPRIRRPAPPQNKPKNSVKVTPRAAPKVPPVKHTPKKPPPKQPKKEKRKKDKTPMQKEAETVFLSKPAMVKRSREKEDTILEYEDDNNNVFKAKEERKETKGAREVKETRDTAIELPIDQIAAEEVEEEVLVEETQDYPPPQEEKYPPSEDQYPPSEDQYPPSEDQYPVEEFLSAVGEEVQESEPPPVEEVREDTMFRDEASLREEVYQREETAQQNETPRQEATPRSEAPPVDDTVSYTREENYGDVPQDAEDLIQERLEEVEETRQYGDEDGRDEEEQAKKSLKKASSRKTSSRKTPTRKMSINSNTNQNNSVVDLHQSERTITSSERAVSLLPTSESNQRDLEIGHDHENERKDFLPENADHSQTRNDRKSASSLRSVTSLANQRADAETDAAEGGENMDEIVENNETTKMEEEIERVIKDNIGTVKDDGRVGHEEIENGDVRKDGVMEEVGKGDDLERKAEAVNNEESFVRDDKMERNNKVGDVGNKDGKHSEADPSEANDLTGQGQDEGQAQKKETDSSEVSRGQYDAAKLNDNVKKIDMLEERVVMDMNREQSVNAADVLAGR